MAGLPQGGLAGEGEPGGEMEPHPQDGPLRMSVPPRDPDRGGLD